MPYFVVGIRGNADRAAGLLAKAGIQNVPSQGIWIGPDGSAEYPPFPSVSARLSADDPESAVRRVRAALEGEPFTVEDNARGEEPESPR
jgi:hypothetical protein